MHNKETLEEQVILCCLPLCIIFEILSRLPTQSILICRSVCKSWYALTHESSFIKTQFQWLKDHEPTRYILQDPYGDDPQKLSLLDIQKKILTKLSPNQMYNLYSYSIVSSCNGLLCLRPKDKLDSVIISNPMTKECLFLPSITTFLGAFLSYQLGFHFNYSSNNYKVIREFRRFTNEPSRFQLITVGESSWKDLDSPECEVEQGFDAAIFWNDGFHWKISERESRNGKKCILRYDLIEEKFVIISYPKEYDGICYYPHTYQIAALGEDLKVVEYDLSCFVRIWKVTSKKCSNLLPSSSTSVPDRDPGFSMVLQYTYTLCVQPTRMWQQDMISEIGRELYLMQVNTGVNECILEIFSAIMGYHRELEIDALPSTMFKIICFKPSLLSPLS